jgi:hypothetical protein
VFALLQTVTAPAAALDLELYAELLERHTAAVEDVAGVRVDYRALVDSLDWQNLVESLAEAPAPPASDRAAFLAFWINAYNVLAIDVVLQNYPLASIKDAGSLLRPVWKRRAGLAAGRSRTLHEIEHEILRATGDPRIHGAIVCASLSCPPLARTPYRAASLDADLERNLRAWLADPRKGVDVDRARGTLPLSPIFDWFEADFGGEAGVRSFVARYAPDAEAGWIEAHPDAPIDTLDYDWSLNDLAR